MKKKHSASIRGTLRASGLVLLDGFLLNLIWENAQAPLYLDYSGFYSHLKICFVAAVVDALVILLLYLLLVAYNQNLYWPMGAGPWQYLFLTLLGGLLAVWFEKWALQGGEWSYTEVMPIVPVLRVGLFPLLQLMVLPIIACWVSSCIVRPHLT
ncbi:hypothetical protein GCM10023188_30780 [Pontibacter saemangeumensis]|uniref:Uncharacterized protein n=1 Tax=Pontibacter saemangeumensis TaxID=1084525 RepID=A0ABP8LW17_9BACT